MGRRSIISYTENKTKNSYFEDKWGGSVGEEREREARWNPHSFVSSPWEE